MKPASETATTLLVALSLFVPAAAPAARVERAAHQARMHEFDGSGQEIRAKLAKFLTLNRKIHGGEPSSLEFGEVTAEQCTTVGCTSSWVGYRFCMKSVVLDPCHAVRYTAEVKFRHDGKAEPTVLTMELTDHTKSKCEPARKWKWEAVMTGNHGFQERRFSGNPKVAMGPGVLGCASGVCGATNTIYFDLDE